MSEHCPTCGPGYRYGDDGCRHTPPEAPTGGDWREQPHEFRENVNDASMCLCGIPDLTHDGVMAKRKALTGGDVEALVLDEPAVPDVRSVLAAYMLRDGYTAVEVNEQVDAMLVAHDQAARAEAWDEGYDACWNDADAGAFPGEQADNPYRAALRAAQPTAPGDDRG